MLELLHRTVSYAAYIFYSLTYIYSIQKRTVLPDKPWVRNIFWPQRGSFLGGPEWEAGKGSGISKRRGNSLVYNPWANAKTCKISLLFARAWIDKALDSGKLCEAHRSFAAPSCMELWAIPLYIIPYWVWRENSNGAARQHVGAQHPIICSTFWLFLDASTPMDQFHLWP